MIDRRYGTPIVYLLVLVIDSLIKVSSLSTVYHKRCNATHIAQSLPPHQWYIYEGCSNSRRMIRKWSLGSSCWRRCRVVWRHLTKRDDRVWSISSIQETLLHGMLLRWSLLSNLYKLGYTCPPQHLYTLKSRQNESSKPELSLKRTCISVPDFSFSFVIQPL